MGATGKIKSRLEKLGIQGLIPENHWMDNRLNALKEGFAIIYGRQGGNWELIIDD